MTDEAKKLKIDRIAYIFSRADDLKILNRFLNIKDSNGKKAIHIAVGNNILLRMFYTSGQFTYLDNQDEKGKTPLHYAAENGEIKSIELIKEIDDSDFSILDKAQKNPFDLALENNRQEALIYLVNFKSSVELNSKRFNLILKNKNIDYKIVKEIYEKGIDFNFRENGGNTVLINIINKIVEEKSLANKTQVYEFCKDVLKEILKNCNYDIQQKNGGDSLLHTLIKNDMDEEEILVFLERVEIEISDFEKREKFLKNLDSKQEKCLNYAIDKDLAKVTKKILELYTKDSRELKLGIKTGMLNLKENALERAMKDHKPHVVITLLHDLNAKLLKKITKENLISDSSDHMRDYFKVISEKDITLKSEFITLLYNGFTEFSEDFNLEENKAIIESIRQGNKNSFDSLFKGYIERNHKNLNKHEEEAILSFLFECLKNRKGEWALYMLGNENIKQNLQQMDDDKKLKILLLSCFFNENNVEKFLIEQIKGMKNLVDKENLKTDQITALMFASSRGYIDIIKILLDSGMDVNTKDKYYWTPIMYAIGNNQKEITELLIAKEADLSNFNQSMNPLIIASAKGNKDIVEILLNTNKVLVDERNCFKETALMWSAAQGHKEIVELLIEKGANIDACDEKHISVLYLAFFNKRYEIIDVLLSKGVNSSFYNECGEKFIFDLLVKKIDSLNDDQKIFVLTFAVKQDNKEIVKILLSKGMDVNLKDTIGKTVFIYAIKNGNEGIVKILLDKAVDVNLKDKDGKTALMHAIQNGNERIVQILFDNRVDVNAKDKIGKTVLMYAVEKGNKGIVKILLDKAVDVNVNNDYGKTALMYSIGKRNTEIVNMLLDKEANINAEDKDKKTVLMYAVENGDKGIVQILLDKGTDANKEDKSGKTVLMYAVERGNEEVISLLLEKGAEVNKEDKSGKTALMYGIERGNKEVIILLLEKRAEVNKEDKSGKTVLMYAVERGNKEEISLLLEKGAEVNKEDKSGKTALMYGIERGNKEVISLLIEKGADVNKEDERGKTALMYGSERWDVGVISLLVEKGAEVNKEDKIGKTALTYASERENKEVLEVLLKNLAEVNKEDKSGKTALMYGSERWNVGVIILLLEKGAEVNKEDKSGKTALIYGIERGNKEVISLLLEKGAEVNKEDKSGKTALMYGSERWNVEVISLLLEKGAKVNKEDKSGKTSLMYGIERWNIGVISLLVEKGAEVNKEDKSGKTVLMYGSEIGNKEVISLLIEKGAEVNEEDKSGKTVLMYGIEKGNEGVISLLLEKGVEVNKEDKSGKTVLMYGIEKGNEGVVKLFLEKGAEVNKEDKSGKTALMYGSEIGNKEVISLLLEKGAEVNKEDERGKTALMYGSERWDVGVISLLVEKGAEVNKEDKSGKTVLMYGIEKGNEGVISLLLEKGAEVNKEDKSGKTALMYGSERWNLEVISLLLEKGAKVNKEDKSGKTALMYGSERWNIGVISLLLEKGAEVNKEDKSGKTALMYGIERRNKEVISLLLEKGAEVNKEDKNRKTVLMYAILTNDQELIEQLLNKANLNKSSDSMVSTLIIARLLKKDEIFKLLLSKVSEQVKQEFLDVEKEVFNKDKVSLKLNDILVKEIEVFKKDKNDLSFELIVAASLEIGDSSMSLDAGILKDNDNFEIYQNLADCLSLDYIADNFTDISNLNKYCYNGLFFSVLKKDTKCLEKLLNINFFRNFTDYFNDKSKESCISLARKLNKLEHIKILLSFGASPIYNKGTEIKSILDISEINEYVKEKMLFDILNKGRVEDACRLLNADFRVYFDEESNRSECFKVDYQNIINLETNDGNIFHFLAKKRFDEESMNSLLDTIFELPSFSDKLLFGYDNNGMTPFQLALSSLNEFFIKYFLIKKDVKFEDIMKPSKSGKSFDEFVKETNLSKGVIDLFREYVWAKDEKKESDIIWILRTDNDKILSEFIEKNSLKANKSELESIFEKALYLNSPRCLKFILTKMDENRR